MADDIAIGIDLGTSYSCVSIVENGEPVVLPNEWGEVNHASVVSFLEDGTVLVGTAPSATSSPAPRDRVLAKRLIGRYFFSDEVKKAMAVMPYRSSRARTTRCASRCATSSTRCPRSPRWCSRR
jgi:molecular chaperone DnaK